jgi:uncharacterized protein YwqG
VPTVAAAYAEQRRALERRLADHLPAARAAAIAAHVRDAIAIHPRAATERDLAVGASRLGGAPDLPPGATWPSNADGDLQFVAQLRLEQLAELDVHRRLPARGLLSVFGGFRSDHDSACEGRVLLHADVAGLAPRQPPGRPAAAPVGVEFAPRALLPPHSSVLVPRPGAADPYHALYDDHYRVSRDDAESFHGLFGFARPGEDEQRADEELLLRLDADAEAYDMVEAACACFFVPRADLARGDFSRARMYEGATH